MQYPEFSLQMMVRSNVLVIFRKQIGDVLLLQPALERLSRRDGRVSIYARTGFADMLALMPGDIQLAEDSLFPRVKDVYCLESRPAAILQAARALGARKHLLLSRDNAPWWRRLIFDEYKVVDGTNRYRAALYQDLFGFSDEVFVPPRLGLPPADWRPEGLPAAYVVVHPTAAWRQKTWPAANWVNAMRRIRPDASWVLTAGPTRWEVEFAQEIANSFGTRNLINLAGRTSFRQYLAVLASASATLCVDGSASHISSAFGRPTLTLFGPSNAVRWHWPSNRNVCLKAGDFVVQSKPPVSGIPVDAVVEVASDLLATYS